MQSEQLREDDSYRQCGQLGQARIMRGMQYFSDNSSVDSRSPKKRDGNVRSGISARPTSGVKQQQKYPHFSLGQMSGYIGQNIQFHQLNYDQFLAGEMATITSCESQDEIDGRISLMQHITMWKLRANVTWPQIRNAYATIIRKIENQEIGWNADWDRYEKHIYDKVITGSTTLKSDKSKKTATSAGDFLWFCKAFKKQDGCTRESPHPGKVNNIPRQVHHYCATCWQKEHTRKPHPEQGGECPYRPA